MSIVRVTLTPRGGLTLRMSNPRAPFTMDMWPAVSGPPGVVTNASVNTAIGVNPAATRTALELGSAALQAIAAFDAAGAAAAAQAAAIAAAAADATSKANTAQAAAIAAAATDATTKANAAQAAAIAAAATDATTKANAAQAGAMAASEPVQTAASQAEAEAGSGGVIRSWTPQRIWQAIAAKLAQGTWISGATGKTTPVDADTLPLSDSGASGALKSLTWANLVATAKAAIEAGTAFLTGIITPTQLTANTNDWAPTSFSTCRIIRASSDAARAITGLAGGASGRMVSLINVGSFDLLLANESASSTAANRFAIRRGYILPPNRSVTLWYDGTTQRWRFLTETGRTVTVVLAADVVNSNAVANTIADVTGLAFAVITGYTYRFRFVYAYDSAATTTGSRWSVNGPTVSDLYYFAEWAATNTSQVQRYPAKNTYDLPGASNASSELNGNHAIVEGRITPTADGPVTGRMASEVSGSAITARGGLSFVEYECISP